MKCVNSSRSSLFARRGTFMPKEYKWFTSYIFRKKLSAHMIKVLISNPPKSVLLSIYFHNVCKKICWFSMGSNQYWTGRVYKLWVYFMTGTPQGSTESDFQRSRESNLRQVKSHICGGSNPSRLAFAIKIINSRAGSHDRADIITTNHRMHFSK